MAPSLPTGNAYPYFLPPPGIDASLAMTMYQNQQLHNQQQAQHNMFANGGQPTPTSDFSAESPGVNSPAAAGSSGNNFKQPGKRPAKEIEGSRKKAKQDEGDGDEDEDDEKESKETKPKSTRGSRACTVCRRLKMKCVGGENGPPCRRCESGNHECVFEESNRGKRPSKKSEALAHSLRKMEHTLDIVVRSLANPHLKALASGMVSRSPSPDSPRNASVLQNQTQNLTASGSQHVISPSPSHKTPDGGMGSVRSDSSLSHRHTGASRSFSSSQTPRQPSPKLHSLPDNALNPLGLLAEASLNTSRDKNPENEATDEVLSRMREGLPLVGAIQDDPRKVGVASDAYFKPGPMTILPLRRLYIERQIQPEMLSFVSTDEVVALFKIFFDSMNLHCSMLDRDWHTPSLVCSRSPFLLTAICAVSSKFYPARTDLHGRLNKIAKKLAFSVPEQGYKSVEIVQAYLVLSLWGVGPVERFEQDRTWLYLGLAIRMATDLNLHRKSAYCPSDTPEGRQKAIEIRNRERTWLLCFVLDRSFSAQMGKPHSIKEDFIIRNAGQWWQTPDALPQDAGLAAYADYQRILSRSLDFLYSGTSTASGLQTDCDYLLIVKTVEAQLQQWASDWEFHSQHSRAQAEGHFDPLLEYRSLIAKFYLNYAYLVVNSFGLQNALERSKVDIGHFFNRCHTSALACASLVREELAPKGYLRSSPDSHFVLFSYAVLTLLKLIRAEFKTFMGDEKKTLTLVGEMADLLEDIAVNPYHTPALYSTLLRALLSAKTEASIPPSPLSKGVDGPMLTVEPLKTSEGEDGGVNDPGHSPGPTQEAQQLSYAGLFEPSGEMGPVQDMSTFPPTMADASQDQYGMFSMDSLFNNGFWDSVLVPGYSNSLEGLSGGFVYGPGGSGFITPRITSPVVSGANSPSHGVYPSFSQRNLNAAFGSVGN